MVTFDHNKLMQINYDSRLINFVQEVDLLSSMGFKIAPEILQNSTVAKEFMQQAKELEKVSLRIHYRDLLQQIGNGHRRRFIVDK